MWKALVITAAVLCLTSLNIMPCRAQTAEAEEFFQQGLRQLKEEKTDSALISFNLAINADTAFAEAYFERGKLYFYDLTQKEEGLTNLERALKLNPSNEEYLLELASCYSHTGKKDISLAYCNRVLEINPNSYKAYQMRSGTWENHNDSIKDLTKAIELKPGDEVLYIMRGNHLKWKGESDPALNDYNNALSLKPEDSWVYYERGDLFFNNNKLGEAESDFTKAIELNPDYSGAYMKRGLLRSNCREYDQAIADFDQALRLSPNWAYVYGLRSVAVRKSGNPEQALADINTAFDIGAKGSWYYLVRSNAYIELGNFASASADLDKSIEVSPNEIQNRFQRGEFSIAFGNYDKAVEDYTKCLEIKEHREYYFKRAIAYYYKRDYKKAWQDLKTCRQMGRWVDDSFYRALHKAEFK